VGRSDDEVQRYLQQALIGEVEGVQSSYGEEQLKDDDAEVRKFAKQWLEELKKKQR
jgi:hypothetical protein